MDRAVIYARVSSDEQAENTSLDAQTEHCRRYCKEKGYVVAKEYREDYTGTESLRPCMNELIASPQTFDVVVVYQVDRLARSRNAMMVIETELVRLGKRTEFVIGNFDTTPEGNLFKNLMIDFAEFERENLLRRMVSGMYGRAKAGQVRVSRVALYGYNYEREERQGRYVINEDEARWVRQVFDWYTKERLSINEIASRLTKLGVLTKEGKQNWAAITIGRMLSATAYYGEWIFGAKGKLQKVVVPVPAIISKEQFDLAQVQRAQNKLLSKRHTKKPYLLRGRLRCEKCGLTFTSADYRNSFLIYRCRGMMRHSDNNWQATCTKAVSASAIDAAVWAYVRGLILNPEVIIAGAEARRDVLRKSATQIDGMAQTLEANLARLNDRRMRLLDLWADSQIKTRDELDALLAENMKDTEAARERLSDLRASMAETAGPDPDDMRSYSQRLAGAVMDASFEQQEKTIAALDVKGWVAADHKSVRLKHRWGEDVVFIE